jgi:hypothetical protein
MSDVSFLGSAELRRVWRFGPLWAQISCRDQSKFVELGRKVLLSCWDRAVPIMQPPALPAGLRASLQLNDTRPPLQTTHFEREGTIALMPSSLQFFGLPHELAFVTLLYSEHLEL